MKSRTKKQIYVFETIQGERMKKIFLTLGLVVFVFTGCFAIFDDDDQSDNDCCKNSYNDYRCRDNYNSGKKRNACKDDRYRYNYNEKKSDIKPVRITPARNSRSSTPDNNSKVIHRK